MKFNVRCKWDFYSHHHHDSLLFFVPHPHMNHQHGKILSPMNVGWGYLLSKKNCVFTSNVQKKLPTLYMENASGELLLISLQFPVYFPPKARDATHLFSVTNTLHWGSFLVGGWLSPWKGQNVRQMQNFANFSEENRIYKLSLNRISWKSDYKVSE